VRGFGELEIVLVATPGVCDETANTKGMECWWKEE